MKNLSFSLSFAVAALAVGTASAQIAPALTIYNQNFAVVRQHLALDLKSGDDNSFSFAGVTAQVEPDSVVLRDPTGKVPIRVLEQSYRADTISTGLMLQLNEGKTIDFLVRDKDQKEYIVKGKIIRSGYTPGAAADNNGDDDSTRLNQSRNSPIIEVDGQLRFSLPGEPVFPALADDSILRPTLTWQLGTSTPNKLDAELSYVTGGLTWQAAYNLVAPEKGDTMDITGWVTLDNHSGTQFDHATIKLMAGNVNKLVEPRAMAKFAEMDAMVAGAGGMPPVTEKAFDEFHLYTLSRPTTLRDRETKQVEFIRATGVKTQTLYIYDGVAADNYRGWAPETIRNNADYGTVSNKKVSVMREFLNSKENGLGLPLPAGRTRFYRQDDADHSLEFTGENQISHTPEGELVRLYTGDAFDLVGERRRVNFTSNNRNQVFDESFEIKLRNHKKDPVEIRVVEHLYRWNNWDISEKSDPFTKTDAQTIEFRIKLAPDEGKTMTYRVTYQTPGATPARGRANQVAPILPDTPQ